MRKTYVPRNLIAVPLLPHNSIVGYREKSRKKREIRVDRNSSVRAIRKVAPIHLKKLCKALKNNKMY